MAFYDFMQKLLLARQIKFEEGKIELMNQRVVITPIEQIISITELLLEQPKLIPKIYEKERLSFSEGYAEAVHKLYGFENLDFTKWLVELSNICGWGGHQLVKFDQKNQEGILRFYNSPIVKQFKGKTKTPIDHIWRGLTAAGATRIFKKDIDFIETKCAAVGESKFCEFIFKPRDALTTEEKKQYNWQIPIK